ncbi:MAG: hypothetical protein GXP41_12825 [Chloroflexi bacterium]|nr:hypothetical protein [Chloroflexota bacterium]
MAKANVDAGICGYKATVEATSLNGKEIQVEICSDCEMLTAMNEDLVQLQWKGRGHKVFRRMTESAVYESAARHIRHCACIVPAAVLKTIEVETGMALPKKATIEFEE